VDHIKEGKMGGAYVWGTVRVACRVLVWEPEGENALGKPRRRGDDNMKLVHKEIG